MKRDTQADQDTRLDDLAQTKLGLAALFVALAETLAGHDETFLPRLDENLEKIYRKMEDYPAQPIGAMEVLRWAHELLEVPPR